MWVVKRGVAPAQAFVRSCLDDVDGGGRAGIPPYARVRSVLGVRMKPPPLFSSLPRTAQVQLAGLGPVLFGMVCGFLLEASAAGYWVLSTVGLLGAVSGGMEHSGAAAGARRGLLAGSLFGFGLVLAHAIARERELVTIPHPAVLLIAITSVIGTVFGAAGGAVRSRLE